MIEQLCDSVDGETVTEGVERVRHVRPIVVGGTEVGTE